MTNSQNIPTTLRSAADALAKDGWCRNVLKNRNGERCALGAIAFVQGWEQLDNSYILLESDPAVKYLAEYVTDVPGTISDVIREVYRWNDALDEKDNYKTKYDIITTLLNAADHYELGAFK